MAVSSRGNSGHVTLNYDDIRIGETLRVKDLTVIESMIEISFSEDKFVYNDIVFDDRMIRLCGNRYKIIGLSDGIYVQLDTDIKNYNGEGYWLPFEFLER